MPWVSLCLSLRTKFWTQSTTVLVSKTSQKQDREEFGSLNARLVYPAYLVSVQISSSTCMPDILLTMIKCGSQICLWKNEASLKENCPGVLCPSKTAQSEEACIYPGEESFKKQSLNIARSWNTLTGSGQVAAAITCLDSGASLPDVPSKSNSSEIALIIGFWGRQLPGSKVLWCHLRRCTTKRREGVRKENITYVNHLQFNHFSVQLGNE